jgi:hypothetical protein
MLRFHEYERLNEQIGYVLVNDHSIVSGDHGMLLDNGESCFAKLRPLLTANAQPMSVAT